MLCCPQERGNCTLTTDLEHLTADDRCYLTIRGRVTGHSHWIEIWFALNRHTLYFLHEGGMADWVKNVLYQPYVTVSIKEVVLTGRARVVKDHEEDELARQLLAEKYQKSGDQLVRWLRNSFPVIVDLTA